MPPPPYRHCTALPRPRSRALVGEVFTAHCTGVESLKQLAKFPDMQRTSDR